MQTLGLQLYQKRNSGTVVWTPFFLEYSGGYFWKHVNINRKSNYHQKQNKKNQEDAYWTQITEAEALVGRCSSKYSPENNYLRVSLKLKSPQVEALNASNVNKKLQHRCFPGNIAEFLREQFCYGGCIYSLKCCQSEAVAWGCSTNLVFIYRNTHTKYIIYIYVYIHIYMYIYIYIYIYSYIFRYMNIYSFTFGVKHLTSHLRREHG